MKTLKTSASPGNESKANTATLDLELWKLNFSANVCGYKGMKSVKKFKERFAEGLRPLLM